MRDPTPLPAAPWRRRLHEIIFEADTPAGKAFDVALLVAIGASVLAVMLESMPDVRVRHGAGLRAAEWIITVLFSTEYVLRLMSVTRPMRYARSFFGIVDLLAIMPTYASVLLPRAQSLLAAREAARLPHHRRPDGHLQRRDDAAGPAR